MTASVARMGLVRGVMGVVGVVVAALLLGAPAAAQVQPVTAYFAVVTSDDTPLRCGDKAVLYPVARLSKGTLLRVDGQSGGAGAGWLRVAYPPGVVACIGADAIQLDATGKAGSLTKESRLKAFNITSGYKGSWNSILEKPLPTGTKLTLADAEPVNDGRGNAGYRIVPPEQSRAFIQEGAVVRATQTQIDAYMATLTPKAGDPAKTVIADKPTVKPTDPSATTPDAPKAPAVAAKPDQPAQPAEAPAQPVAEAPKGQWERLEAAFEAVRKQPVESAEFTALIGEFQTAIDTFEETPLNAGVRRRLGQRLEALKLQTDIQAEARRVAERKQTLTIDEQKLAERMKDVERTRQYTIVGRLSASTIYDGKRLPLMYRIMAIGGQSSRTLAYIKPDDKLKIDSKLGAVVGVLGESRVDPALKSNVITPVRIDTLEPAPSISPSAPTSEPTPAPASPPSPGGN